MNHEYRINTINLPSSLRKKHSPLTIKSIPKLYRLNYKSNKKVQKRDPYVSFVIPGRNDNYKGSFVKYANNFLHETSEALKLYPLASFEILYIDYAPDINNINNVNKNKELNSLSKAVIVPENLKGKVRFITVPNEIHNEIGYLIKSNNSFFSPLAKNIGIRRAKGSFIALLNGDVILPLSIFKYIATKSFQEMIVYRSFPINLTNGNLTELHNMINGRQKFNYDKMRCPPIWNHNTYFIITSAQNLASDGYPCGIENFVMASQKMWLALCGLDEFPTGYGSDYSILAKFMKMVPGFIQFFLPPIGILGEKVKPQFKISLNHSIISKWYGCSGESLNIKLYSDSPEWGLPTYEFDEEII